MATSSFPIFGTGGFWKSASGSGTPSDPFVPAVNVTGGGVQTPWAQNIDGAGFTLSNAAVRWVTAGGSFAGTNQGNATALIEGVNNLTAADGVKGAVLPTPTNGRTSFVIVNNNTVTALGLVYPQSGGSINGLSANLPWYVPPGVTVFWSNGGATAAWVAQGQSTNGVAPTFTHANSPVGTPLTAIPNCINPVDTSGGTVAVKLPAPSLTQWIGFQDAAATWDSNNFSLVQNGSEKIAGIAATLVCNARGANPFFTTDGTNWLLPSSPAVPSLRTVTDADANVVLADCGTSANVGTILMNSASAHNCIIPANGTIAVPIGYAFQVIQLGAGKVTLTITSDTLNGSGGKVASAGQYAMFGAYKTGATTWVAFGDRS